MLRLLRRESKKPTLDSVHFDTTAYEPLGEPRLGQFRAWRTPEGDGVGAYFHDIPPDLPSNTPSVNRLVSFYENKLRDSGGKLVELGVIAAGGCTVLRTLVSVPQDPSGRTFLGALTLPFKDFSFVVKCQCAEGQPTGVKEAILVDRVMTPQIVQKLGEGSFSLPDFDPDDAQYDVEFPDHPVARARRILHHVVASLVVADAVKALPGFPLPSG